MIFNNTTHLINYITRDIPVHYVKIGSIKKNSSAKNSLFLANAAFYRFFILRMLYKCNGKKTQTGLIIINKGRKLACRLYHICLSTRFIKNFYAFLVLEATGAQFSAKEQHLGN